MNHASRLMMETPALHQEPASIVSWLTRGRRLGWVLLFLWLLAACGTVDEAEIPATVTTTPHVATETAMATSAPSLTPTAEPTATILPATATPLPMPPPTSAPLPTTTHYILWATYSLWATLDVPQRQLTVTQTITYVNNTAVTHTQLPLLVEPARYDRVFQLHSLTDGHEAALPFAWDNGHLLLTLPAPLPPADHLILHMAYSLAMPAQQIALGYTPLQINLGDWYPMEPPYVAERGWVINQPGHVGEHLAYVRADYDVYLRLIPGESEPILAASGYRQTVDGWHHCRLTNARNFAWSVGEYETISGTVDGVEVTSYAFADHAEEAQAAFSATMQAVSLFNELFGPYPHDTLVLIEADFRDGLEFDGLYFLDRGLYQRYNDSPREYLIPIAVHETAHQWWQGLVGNDQAWEPWLDEAMATYSELLFYERHYPDLVEWWWYFRVNRFGPTGAVDSAIYDFDQFRPYVNTVYLRGAMLLHEMRRQVGDGLFLALLQAYVQAGLTNEIVTADTFWCAWQEVTQADSRPLRQRYFADAAFDPVESCP